MNVTQYRKLLTSGKTLTRAIAENPDVPYDTVMRAARSLGYTPQGVSYAYRQNGVHMKPRKANPVKA